jgi:hypothetical protein
MSPTHTNAITSFTVAVANPSGSDVTFTVSDSENLLSSTKMVRGVLCDALDTWIVAEAADLTTNGDEDVVDWQKVRGTEEAVAESKVTWDMQTKKATLALTATTNLDVSSSITATAPFASVYS